MVSALMPAFAESASADFSILLPEFVKVESVFSLYSLQILQIEPETFMLRCAVSLR